MRKHILTLLFAAGMTLAVVAQQSGTSMVIESMPLKPKRGMEEKFEAAVLAHIKKFHPDGGNYTAALRMIEYGPQAGWYVWVMGPVPYTSLDKPLGKENGHKQDWDATIDPLVEEYGGTGLFTFNQDLSFGWDIFKKAKHYELWSVDLKPQQYYRFKDLTAKLKKVYETLGTTAFIVLENNLHFSDGPDIGLIWSFDSYDTWFKDPGPKATWEKLYGAGSWDNAMQEWMDMVKSYDSEIRSTVTQ